MNTPTTCADGNHDFQPRYDYELDSLDLHEIACIMESELGGATLEDAIKFAADANKKYVGDICVRCGQFVKRQPSEDQDD